MSTRLSIDDNCSVSATHRNNRVELIILDADVKLSDYVELTQTAARRLAIELLIAADLAETNK